jgi:hypothetical protein
MAETNPPTPKSGPLPPLPSSGMTGRLKSPTTQLPIKKGGAGKIVVMLSSVAKAAPAVTQALPEGDPASDSPPKVIPAEPAQVVDHPPPLPPTQVAPGSSPQSQLQPRSSATTYVKLPPKTNMPSLTLSSGKPVAAPPPLPAKWSEPKKWGAQHIPPIKLNAPSSQESASGESIFSQADQPKPGPTPAPGPKPEGWKSVEAGELNPPAGGLQSLEVFARSRPVLDTPTPQTPLPEAKAPPLVAPPLLPPVRVETPVSAAKAIQSLRPPPLPPPVAKFAEGFAAPPPPVHVAPPLLEKAPELPSEKLPPPHLPADVRKSETEHLSPSPGVQKVPAMIQPEAPSVGQPPQAVPAKPLLPPAASVAKVTGNWFGKSAPLKKSTPLVVSSSSPKVQSPKIVEAKPALKPAVLPKRLLPGLEESPAKAPQPPVETPKATETAEVVEKSDAPAPAAPAAPAAAAVQTPEIAPPAQPPVPETGLLPFGEKEKTEAKVSPAQPPPAVPVISKVKAPLPPTRAERAKKRRFLETVIFWAVLVPATVLVLLVGSLYFGRDTRVEGQVIPPPDTTLNNEVWIVTDFSSLAAGIADDLAKERVPLLQEIQERQDHVQRAQADVASREERLRLIAQEIQASKDEIVSVINQSREDTQQIWDGEGAQIDAEYQSRFNQLKQMISDRAKSLKLNYQPDVNFPSPEVWANAYRLALYQVPPGVDSVKEHQWLADQMTQWRNFLKTLDDRKEQLREKAAQIKLAPAPKIADLNSKIDDLQQRSDATTAEEVPLKAELQQAEADLATAQTEEAGLDDKYYKQLDSLPEEAITKHIPLAANGRFTWVDDDVFAEGEKEHRYWIFVRATRADGRQYWALHNFSMSPNRRVELYVEPAGFISTKAILRPDLSPDEQQQ